MTEIYPYEELCVRINNEHEYYELIDMLKKTRKPQRYNLDEIIENLPNYMFINFKGYNIELCYLTDDNIDDKVELLNDVLSEEHIDPNIYTIDDMKIIENIINTGKKYIKPTYQPKSKNKRLLENLNINFLKKGKYKVISILVNKYSEKIKFQNIIGDYLKTVISDPPICYVIFTEHIGSFRSDKVYTAGYNGDYMKYNFYRDKGHELNLNEDDISPVFNIDEFEQYYNNISKPSYKPKINKRLLEKYDINKVTNICVELNNRREINKIIELLEEYNFNIINELYNNDHLYLFINFINKSLSYCEFYQMDYDFENNSWLMDVWKKVLTINDIDTIKKIITNKVLFLPSYEPKEKPKRLLESKWFKLNNSIYLNKYKYRYVIFNFYTIEELHLFENYMLRFKDILSVDNFNYFINLAEEKLNSVYDHVYFRFFNKNGTLDFLWGTDDHNTDIDDYEKDFNIKDLTDGILENIIKYGSSIKSPTYQPKKINREL